MIDRSDKNMRKYADLWVYDVNELREPWLVTLKNSDKLPIEFIGYSFIKILMQRRQKKINSSKP